MANQQKIRKTGDTRSSFFLLTGTVISQWRRQTDRQTDIATVWLYVPRGQYNKKKSHIRETLKRIALEAQIVALAKNS